MSPMGQETGKQMRSERYVRIPKGRKRRDQDRADATIQWLDL
jgi:hypothetical protein